jgi:hypothetical protein
MAASVEVDQAQVNRLLLDLVAIGERHGIRFPRECLQENRLQEMACSLWCGAACRIHVPCVKGNDYDS